LNSAEIQLSYTKVKAEWNDPGNYRVIGEKFIDEGSMLTATTPIVSMLDITTMIAVIDIIESDYAKVKVGEVAQITSDSYPDQVFTGKIARIAPLLDEASRQARVEIEIPNPQSLLKPGMYARVQIIFAQKKNATVIPAAALCMNKKVQGVFLVDLQTKKVKFVEVKTGIQNNDYIEVISPQLSGVVVTLGQDQLDDGKSITLPKPEGKKDSARQKGKSA
jgi:RND family efflux transporter MFP subunit